MTRLDDDEASILAQARRALAPTSADQERIWQRLVLEPALSAGPKSSKPLPGRAWSWRVLGAVALAVALSGGLGYKLGFRAGIAQKNQLVVSTNAVLPVPPASAASASAPTTSEPSTSTAAELPPPVTPKPSSAAAFAHPRSVPSAAPTALGLDEEVRQLRRVERAIRESNPRFALVLLEELDQAIPKGQLLEERGAARIMASCQLGAGSAVADARAFIEQHAASAYRTRVIELCGLTGERNSAAPGTHVPR
ncbi:MAG TPA: hypothetical protein VFK05_37780 [Polyangiaceae bacterium]|nr:hypothetical protein [Polyangiaceae bacterium]